MEAFKKCYVEMLKIRDQFPDDENDEENLVTENSQVVTAETNKLSEKEDEKKRKALPKINIDPSLVTPISI